MAQKTKTFNHESASATTEQALESRTTQMMGVSESEISAEQEVCVQAPADASSAETNDNGFMAQVAEKVLTEVAKHSEIKPEMKWTIKGAFGALCVTSLGTSGYFAYKKDTRGLFCSGGLTFLSGLLYWALDKRDMNNQKKSYQQEVNLAKIMHPVRQVLQNQQANDQLMVVPTTEQEMLSSIVDLSESSPLGGCSSEELFAKPTTNTHTDKQNWVVDGYMKGGLVNLLVAGGGVGKTTLLVQIVLAVSKGARPEFLPDDCCDSVKLSVVYYRLEVFPDEFSGKYGNGKVMYGSGIKWFEPNDLPDNTLEGFAMHLKRLAAQLTEDTLLCIDPATKLDNYRHKDFISVVEEAMKIAKEQGVTLTIVASIHLDEIKDWTRLTNCDIKGGDKGLQLAGSVTALRKERTNVDKYRFLQCLKEPKGSPKPFDGKVLVCKTVEKELDDNNKYLHYEFDCLKLEKDALPPKPKAIHTTEDSSVSPEGYHKSAPNQKITLKKLEQMKVMLAKGIPDKDIAKELGVTDRTIRTYKKAFKEEAA